jgi:AcrR family transcriptional regulator
MHVHMEDEMEEVNGKNGTNDDRSTWRERERERAREAILHAAADTFALSGYARTSMKDIAAHAGISVGMLYNHFKGKEEIFQELIEHYITHLEEKADGACNDDDPPIEQILTRLRSGVEFYWENRSLAMMYLNENPLRLEVVVKGWEKKSRNAISDLLGQAMERGDLVREDPNVVAALIVGGVHRLLYMLFKEGDENDFNSIPDIIYRIVLKPLERDRQGRPEEENR